MQWTPNQNWRNTVAFSWWIVRFDSAHNTHFRDQGAPDEVHDFFAQHMEQDPDFWLGEVWPE